MTDPTPERVLGLLREFLARVGKPGDVDAETPLFAEGIGLDSLETAELSATLEDTFGSDPFQSSTMPQTVGGILGFYERSAVQT